MSNVIRTCLTPLSVIVAGHNEAVEKVILQRAILPLCSVFFSLLIQAGQFIFPAAYFDKLTGRPLAGCPG